MLSQNCFGGIFRRKSALHFDKYCFRNLQNIFKQFYWRL